MTETLITDLSRIAEFRVTSRSSDMTYLGVSVHHLALRDEPRFQELLRRMNLPTS